MADPPSADAAAPRITQAGELRSARLESVRAVAALGVLAAHVLVISYDRQLAGVAADPVHEAVLGAGSAVLLFFVLSGYLLFWPFARQLFDGGRRVDVATYARNRALRLLPLYFFVIAVVLVLKEHGGSWEQWLLLATFTQAQDAGAFEVVPVAWSVAIEVHFYILLPLLAAAVGALAKGSLARAATLLALVGSASLAVRVFTVYDGSWSSVPWRYSLLGMLFMFVAGMAIALLRIAWERRPPRLPGWAARGDAWLVAALLLWYAGIQTYRAEILVVVAAFLVVGACVLPLRAGPLVRIFDTRALALVGIASYSLYMWHFPVLEWMQAWYPEASDFRLLGLAAVPLCLAVAATSYLLVERPFLTLRRRWGSTTAQPPPERRSATALPSTAE